MIPLLFSKKTFWYLKKNDAKAKYIDLEIRIPINNFDKEFP